MSNYKNLNKVLNRSQKEMVFNMIRKRLMSGLDGYQKNPSYGNYVGLIGHYRNVGRNC